MECHGDAVDDDAVDDNAVDDAAVDDDDMMMLLPCPCWLAADEDPPDGADVSGCPGSLIKCGSLIAILMMITIDGLKKKKPCDDDVNLGPTGAKDAPSLLHCDPAEAETKFKFISFF